ncbi:helix-turn-helix domain-containing protein [Megasphaera stantonii]|uniref:helix-turn-helix domain-containing protein n=1 Tax=Megasphaera stantonii TaxID=2144175 RepID=UPI002942362C|nr:helix-turn-helix domain-containing protein [Megasphaera stantonii]
MEKERIYPDDADRLLSIDEVAARLRTSPAFVRELMDAGLLIGLKFKKNRRVRKVTLNRFLEKYDGCDMYDVLQQAVGAEK